MNPQDVKTNADRLRVCDDYLAILRQQEANLKKTQMRCQLWQPQDNPQLPQVI